MPHYAPPENYRGTPSRVDLRAGTELWRVHSRDYHPCAFNPRLADTHFGGGRFDGTKDDPYAYMYAAFDRVTAVAESFLRSLPADDRGYRTLLRATVNHRRLACLRTTADLALITLETTADLGAVGQDEWLVQTEARDYAFTRRWAHWLREQAPWAQGIIWRSKREIGARSLILFHDRCPYPGVELCRSPGFDLDDAAGAKWLNDVLADYRVTIRPPAPV
ncbi:MAG TPA: RES family NAD+ phosphorylase [Actinocrinis sp.]|uniref:RES family NAD+ phosphorylase n=1 Tax=Actinocrinis sp. TaxID=1920516 RepID=UPI002DDD3382|nr:RES family NAD+ phosphorylase [Actinocrinis sp.]HEV2347318.1 RES family NAD+ phosphorylase [Actinocrinis sp.]